MDISPKDGSIAGLRVLEHMVDTVLYFEGETSRELRMLEVWKNRFGSTSEIGIFWDDSRRTYKCKDIASKFFWKSKPKSGSALTVVMEESCYNFGSSSTCNWSTYPNPKRSATGFDINRLTMLLALLEKKIDLPLNNYDVFINAGVAE